MQPWLKFTGVFLAGLVAGLVVGALVADKRSERFELFGANPKAVLKIDRRTGDVWATYWERGVDWVPWKYVNTWDKICDFLTAEPDEVDPKVDPP